MRRIDIRDAGTGDAQAIADIYNHYVQHTTSTFDTEPKSVEDRLAWMQSRESRHPVVVASDEGRVVGWGALTRWAERPAWRHTVELSLYVDPERLGEGVGSALMESLLERAALEGHHAVIGQIVSENEGSLSLAARFGFEEVGRLREVGHKSGRWLDVVLVERRA